MEEPDARVVGDDAQGRGVHRGDVHGVPADGVRLTLHDRRVERGVVRRVVLRPPDDLHFVSVKMAKVKGTSNYFM